MLTEGEKLGSVLTEGEVEKLTDPDGSVLVELLGAVLTVGDADDEPLGAVLTVGEALGLVLGEGDRLAEELVETDVLADKLGETQGLGVTVGDGLLDNDGVGISFSQSRTTRVKKG